MKSLDADKKGIARIGHGAKLHPVVFTDKGVLFICHCPATQNGYAAHKITWSRECDVKQATCAGRVGLK